MNHKYMTDEHKKKISESCKKNGVGKWMIGKKPSLENIEKRRNSMKGYNPSQETREKLRMAMLGKKLSHETIEKLKKSHTGIKYINRKSPKPFSIEHRIKIGKYSTGELNHNWKGGITPLRKQTTHLQVKFRRRYLHTHLLKRLRNQINSPLFLNQSKASLIQRKSPPPRTETIKLFPFLESTDDGNNLLEIVFAPVSFSNKAY